MGRTPSSLAMKMLNFASLDPLIRESGRRGLGNASVGDRHIWKEFEAHREEAVNKFEQRLESLGLAEPPDDIPKNETEILRIVKQRRGQRFFSSKCDGKLQLNVLYIRPFGSAIVNCQSHCAVAR